VGQLEARAAQWLADQKVILVGADTWAVEVIPGEDASVAFPVHALLLTDNGIHIIENVRTDLMAAEVAATKRATFFLNMTVPKAAERPARSSTSRQSNKCRGGGSTWQRMVVRRRPGWGAASSSRL
jgi:hypothetical protein